MTGAVDGADGEDRIDGEEDWLDDDADWLDDGGVIERVVTVGIEKGLHARPAARLVEQAGRHDAALGIATARESDPVRADSMLALTSLGVRSGDRVRLLAAGPDAERAVRAAAAVLEGGGTDD